MGGRGMASGQGGVMRARIEQAVAFPRVFLPGA